MVSYNLELLWIWTLVGSPIGIIHIFAIHTGIFPTFIADGVSVIVVNILYLCRWKRCVLLSATYFLNEIASLQSLLNLVTQTVPRKCGWTGSRQKCSTLTFKNRLAILKFNGNLVIFDKSPRYQSLYGPFFIIAWHVREYWAPKIFEVSRVVCSLGMQRAHKETALTGITSYFLR